MNRETIIQMARESGLVHRVHLGSEAARELSIRKMQAFAALVAAKEREDCAKWYAEKGWLLDKEDVPAAIRARGDAV